MTKSINPYHNPKATTPEREELIQQEMYDLSKDNAFLDELHIFRQNCFGLKEGYLPDQTPWTLRAMFYADQRGQRGETWLIENLQGIKAWLDKVQMDVLGKESLVSWMGTKAPPSIRAVVHD